MTLLWDVFLISQAMSSVPSISCPPSIRFTHMPLFVGQGMEVWVILCHGCYCIWLSSPWIVSSSLPTGLSSESLPQQSSLVCLTSFWPHGWPQVFSFVAPTRVVIHIYLSGHLIKVSPFYQCINYTPRNPACFFLSETFSAPSKVPVNICK